MFRLDAKTALVTGAGSGIGAAIAQLFARQGATSSAWARVETPFVKTRLAEYPDPEQAYREMAATQLNGRMARPDELAAAALYLADDESAMVTGSNLLVDGGWSVGKQPFIP